jgi:hypothetical protein
VPFTNTGPDAERIEGGRRLRPVVGEARAVPLPKYVLEAAAEMVPRARGEPPPW